MKESAVNGSMKANKQRAQVGTNFISCIKNLKYYVVASMLSRKWYTLKRCKRSN